MPLRATVTKRIEKDFQEIKGELKIKLATVDLLSLTTDCWTNPVAL